MKLYNGRLSRQGHGSYMITSQGRSLNTTLMEENQKNIVPFTFGRSDIILCTLHCQS